MGVATNITDNEIIKALEYCKDCSANLNVEIIDLINRQQEEIERLTERVHFLCGKSGALQGEIHKYQKEIVRLEYENEILSKNADNAFQDGLNEAQDLYAEQVKAEIKSKAIKELISCATDLCYKEFENDLEVAHTFASILTEAQKEKVGED